MKRRGKFEKRGYLAMQAAFFGAEFEVAEPESFREDGDAAIVSICGPLTHHAEWFWDSYDAIKERVAAALASSAKVVVLDIDSPGGDVAGCFETAAELRAMAVEAKKQLFAYCNGNMCSGAYALACAAEFIAAPPTGMIGSIGVISTFIDLTKMDASFGVRYAFVTSGKRKADGNPHTPISEGALEAEQSRVDALANQFFALVSTSRGIPVDALRKLEANVFVGEDAESARLVDGIMTFDSLVARASGSEEPMKRKSAKTSWKEEMKKAADEGDEEAKKALAALDDDEKKEDEKSEDEKDDQKSESEDDEKKDDEKAEDDDEEKSQAAIASKARLVAEQGDQDRRIAALERDAEDSKREKILAARPDLTPTQLKALRAEPLEVMNRMLALIPKPKPDPAAALSTEPTIGAGQGSRGTRLPKAEADDLDDRMGIERKQEVRWDRDKRVFPQITKDTAKEILAKKSAHGAHDGGSQ